MPVLVSGWLPFTFCTLVVFGPDSLVGDVALSLLPQAKNNAEAARQKIIFFIVEGFDSLFTLLQ